MSNDVTTMLDGLSTEEKIALLKGLQKEKKELNASLKEDKQDLADVIWEAGGVRLQEYFDGAIGTYSFNAVVKHPDTGADQKVQFIIRPAASKKQAANGSGETESDESDESDETE